MKSFQFLHPFFQLFQCLLLVGVKEAFFILIHGLGHPRESLIFQLLVVHQPLFVKLLIIMRLRVRMMLPEFLLDVQVAEHSHLAWQFLPMNCQDQIVQPYALSEHFLIHDPQLLSLIKPFPPSSATNQIYSLNTRKSVLTSIIISFSRLFQSSNHNKSAFKKFSQCRLFQLKISVKHHLSRSFKLPLPYRMLRVDSRIMIDGNSFCCQTSSKEKGYDIGQYRRGIYYHGLGAVKTSWYPAHFRKSSSKGLSQVDSERSSKTPAMERDSSGPSIATASCLSSRRRFLNVSLGSSITINLRMIMSLKMGMESEAFNLYLMLSMLLITLFLKILSSLMSSNIINDDSIPFLFQKLSSNHQQFLLPSSSMAAKLSNLSRFRVPHFRFDFLL